VRRGTVLIRSERPLAGEQAVSPTSQLARWLAEDGRTVAIQSCRGRGDSQGKFSPFADEVADGGEALRWIADQSWFDGELVLLGVGYSAFAAWAALSAASAPASFAQRAQVSRSEPKASEDHQGGERRPAVTALAPGLGARDPYAWLHRGGVLQLEAALALAARLDGRT